MKKYIIVGIIFCTSNLTGMKTTMSYELDIKKITNVSPEQWQDHAIDSFSYDFGEESCTVECIQNFFHRFTVTKKATKSKSHDNFWPHQMSIGNCVAQLWLLFNNSHSD